MPGRNDSRGTAGAGGIKDLVAKPRGLAGVGRLPAVIVEAIELLGHEVSAPSVKQHLAAIRMLFDWMVVGQAMRFNPGGDMARPDQTNGAAQGSRYAGVAADFVEPAAVPGVSGDPGRRVAAGAFY